MPTDSAPAPIVLWAWERPEALGFAREAGIAVLVGTLRLAGERLLPSPRLQPLELPQGSRPTAVVRIESDLENRPALTATQRRRAVAAIRAWALTLPGAATLQVDFDATVSERAFYRQLLGELRAELPAALPLSITALASWCLGDRWLGGLPITEAVPMLFRMGTDAEAVRATLARGTDFSEPLCRSSYGLASDEPWPPLEPGRRLYLFHSQSWTPAVYDDLRRRLDRQIQGGSSSWRIAAIDWF